MKILAITPTGKEYQFRTFSAHSVPASSAQVICEALNRSGYRLRSGEQWHLYDIGELDSAYPVARFQSFRRRSGKIFEYPVYKY